MPKIGPFGTAVHKFFAKKSSDLFQRKEAQLSPAELSELTRDIGNQLTYFGKQEAANVLPEHNLRQEIEGISKLTPRRALAGAGGALLGAGALGGLDALMQRVALGTHSLPRTLGHAAAGAVLGFEVTKNRLRQRELRKLLEERFGNE